MGVKVGLEGNFVFLFYALIRAVVELWVWIWCRIERRTPFCTSSDYELLVLYLFSCNDFEYCNVIL